MKKPNEIDACNAFIRILKKITSIEYEIECNPDENGSGSKEVDFILISNDVRPHRIAVEHTIVESYERQIAYGNQSYDAVEQINVQCKGKLPTSHYYFLAIPLSVISSLKGNRKKQFVGKMASWTCGTAKNLTTNQWSSLTYNNQDIRLICCGSHPEMNGNVYRIPNQPKEIEKRERARLRRAIKEKLPKFLKYKLKGITTSLLLEDISGIFLNHQRRKKDLTIIQRFLVLLFVDYVIIFVSNKNRMVVGNVWKEKMRWYSIIPDNRKFTF